RDSRGHRDTASRVLVESIDAPAGSTAAQIWKAVHAGAGRGIGACRMHRAQGPPRGGPFVSVSFGILPRVRRWRALVRARMFVRSLNLRSRSRASRQQAETET